MIYGGVGRLQASAADCVGQPYHLPSDLIVTLLTELAQVENQGSPGRSLDRAARPPNRWIKRRLPCFCACASVRVACLWKTSLFSPSAADQCLPLRGRLCSRWPTLHECECWSLPFPPPSSGETGTTSFRKKGKKKSSWSFKRHGITLSAKSCPVRRRDFAGKSDPECCSSGLSCQELQLRGSSSWYSETSSSRPVWTNLCGIVLCCFSQTSGLNIEKKAIVFIFY